MIKTRWTTLSTATVIAVGLALVSGGSPVGAATKRTTKKVTTTTAKPRAARAAKKPAAARTPTTLPATEALTTSDTTVTASDLETAETTTSAAPPTEPKRTEPPKTEPQRTEPPKTEPQRTEPPRTLPTVPQTTKPTPTSQPSTEIRTPSTLGLRCGVVERNVRCEWSGDAQGGVRYLLLRGHAGDAAGRVIGPFDMSVHTASDITPPSKLTFSYLVIVQDANGKNTAHSDPVSVAIP